MIDFKKFKKVSSDKHTTVLKHDDGHEFKVVHSVLSPKLKKDIARLPMADGGEATWHPDKATPTLKELTPEERQRPIQPQGSQVSPAASNEPLSAEERDRLRPRYAEGEKVTDPYKDYDPKLEAIEPSGFLPGFTGVGRLPAIGQTDIPYGTPESPPAPLPPPIVSPTERAGAAVLGGMRDTVQNPENYGNVSPQPAPLPDSYVKIDGQVTPTKPGVEAPPENPLLTKVNQITAPQPNLAPQMQQAAQQHIDDTQRISQQFQANKAKIDAEHANLVHDIANNHISMGDYWKVNDKGAAALGALLGGMGSGLTHMANPVPGMIQSSQENFLKAEMANMDNPKSLLSAVQAQYGNNKDSADVMRILSNEALSSQLQKVMAPLNSAQAQAQASSVQLQLLQNTEALKMQIAMRQALSSGQTSQIDPARRIMLMQKSGLINDAQYAQMNKELGEGTSLEQLRSNLHESFDDLNKKMLAGTFSPHDRASAINAYAGKLAHLAEGRFNFAESQIQINALLPQPLDSEETRANKMHRIDALMDSMVRTPTLKGFGMEVPKMGSVTVIAPNGQSGTIPRAQLADALSKGYKRAQ